MAKATTAKTAAAKTKKVASAPTVAATAATEATRSVVSIGVMVLLLIFVVIPMLPWAAKQAVSATVEAAKDSATDLPAYPLPARRSGLDRDPTATPPTSVPYGPPNGPVRPLPSQLQAAPRVAAPSARGNLPALGSGPGGGVLGELPVVGPIITTGLGALGPGLKALAAP